MERRAIKKPAAAAGVARPEKPLVPGRLRNHRFRCVRGSAFSERPSCFVGIRTGAPYLVRRTTTRFFCSGDSSNSCAAFSIAVCSSDASTSPRERAGVERMRVTRQVCSDLKASEGIPEPVKALKEAIVEYNISPVPRARLPRAE
jgi:hypothetical protein